MKSCYISDFRDGDAVDDVFLICSKSFSVSQNGASYARVRLADKSGQIEAMHWDAGENAYSGIAVDDYVHVRGQVSSYREKLQVRIDSIRKCSEDRVDPTDFLPVTSKNRDQMKKDLLRVIDSIVHQQLAKLLKMFFYDENFMDTFCTAPAASKLHHAYIGGLLEHSLSVAKLCDTVSEHYPQVNRDLLVAGAMLHDIGKVEELCWNRSIKYTDTGHLLGHITIGASMVEHAAEKIIDLHPMLKTMLIHMILSHHGEREFGSPKRPKSLEAIILHYADDMDAKVTAFQQAVDAIEDAGAWTERHWMFERPLFKGLPDSVMGQAPKSSVQSRSEDEEPDPFDFDLFAEN